MGFDDDVDFPDSSKPTDSFEAKPVPANLEEKFEKSLSGIGGTLEYASVKGQFRQPVHFVASIGVRVLLCIRGTASLTDIMTDLECDQVELPKGIGGTSVETLLAHAGFAQSAEWVVAQVFDHIVEALGKAGPQAKLEVIGHSLGAGVAALSFLHLRSKLQDAGKLPADCKCFAFAAPPCVSAELAADAAGLGITSVVQHDDIIPRLSQHNLERLRTEILCDTDWRNIMKADFEKTAAGAMAKELGVKYDELQKDMCAATDSYKNAAREKVLAFTGKDEYEFGDITKTAAKKMSVAVNNQAQKMNEMFGKYGKSPFAGKKSNKAGSDKEDDCSTGPVENDIEDTKDGDSAGGMTVEDSKAIRLAMLPPVLLPPGRNVFLKRMEADAYLPRVVGTDQFKRIELSKTMLADHKLGKYSVALKNTQTFS
jgi:hypothetical protein